MSKEKYIIPEKMSDAELNKKLEDFNFKYGGDIVEHLKTGGLYFIDRFVVLNQNGVSEYAVSYRSYFPEQHPLLGNIRYTRPCHEFFDGRFIITTGVRG